MFIFDINSYYKITNILGNNIYTYEKDNIFYAWENELDENVVGMYLSFFIKDNLGKYERFNEEHYEKAYKETEIESLLNYIGFQVLNKYDGYSLNKVKENSERLLYVVKK